jgi:hypothetical protein
MGAVDWEAFERAAFDAWRTAGAAQGRRRP